MLIYFYEAFEAYHLEKYAGCCTRPLAMWQINRLFQHEDGNYKALVFITGSDALLGTPDTRRKPSNNLSRRKYES
jgi:hypothetical protein